MMDLARSLRRALRLALDDRVGSPAELAVFDRILCGGDPRFGQVRGQLELRGAVRREHPSPDRIRIWTTHANDDLTFALEVNRIESAWLTVRDTVSGRDLAFRLVLQRHGFLGGLEGRTVDGEPWPRPWSVEPPTSDEPCEPRLELPPADVAKRFQAEARQELEAWLGGRIVKAAEFWPPPSEASIARRELEVEGHVPPQFRESLAITDGLTVGGVRVLGMDAYAVDSIHLPALLIAWDADDQEDFVVVISLAGDDDTAFRIDVHDPAAVPRRLGDLRAYLRRLALAR